MPLHLHWPPTRETVARLLFDQDRKRIREARIESRARAHEALARHRTRPYPSGVEASTIDPPESEAA